MRRGLLVGLAALALVPAAGATPGFRYGVAAGEMTSTSALLWARSNELGPVRVFLWPSPRKGMPFVQISLKPEDGHDRVVQRRIHGLKPGTRYTYLFSAPYRKTEIASGGTFRTAPAAGTARPCASRSPATPTEPAIRHGKPAYNGFQVYGRMAAERNDFNINLGDTIYSDSEVGGDPARAHGAGEVGEVPAEPRLRAPARRSARRPALQPLGRPRVRQRLHAAPSTAGAIYRAGVKAFTDYAPVSLRRGTASTARSAGASTSSSSSSTSARSAAAKVPRDLQATTSRRRPRSRCGTLSQRSCPSLATAGAAALPRRDRRPVAHDARRAPVRGVHEARSSASTATFKVIVNEVPIQQFFALPYDRWEGYAAEREKLLRFLQRNVRNVVVLTTDTHANLVGEVRLQTFGAGGPVGTGIWEVVTGPVATNTQYRGGRRDARPARHRARRSRRSSSSRRRRAASAWPARAPTSTATPR